MPLDLTPLVAAVAAVLLTVAAGLVRRRLWHDVPGVLVAGGLAGVAIWTVVAVPPAQRLAPQTGVVAAAFLLAHLGPGLELLGRAARLRGAWGLAQVAYVLSWLSWPTAPAWLAWRAARATRRAPQLAGTRPEAAVASLAELSGLRRVASRLRRPELDAWLAEADLRTQLAVAQAQGPEAARAAWARLADLALVASKGAFESAVGGAVEGASGPATSLPIELAVEALLEARRPDAAAALLHVRMALRGADTVDGAAGRARARDLDDEVALLRAQLALAARWPGPARDAAARALAPGSAVRGVLGRRQRQRLLAAEPSPPGGVGRALARSLEQARALPLGVATVRRPPAMTSGLVLALLALHAAASGTGGVDDVALLRQGALVPSQLLDAPAAHAWRLWAHLGLHGGWVHALANATFLWVFASALERLSGPWVLLGAAALSGLGGAAGHIVFGPPDVPALGLSGAASGVFALAMTTLAQERERFPPGYSRRMRALFVSLVVINLAIGLLVPFISLAAHAGGFFAGLGLAALRRRGRDSAARVVAWGGGAAWALGVWLVAVGLPEARTAPLDRVVATHDESVPASVTDAAPLGGGRPELEVTLRRPRHWEPVAPEQLALAAAEARSAGQDAPLGPLWLGANRRLRAVEVACLSVHGEEELRRAATAQGMADDDRAQLDAMPAQERPAVRYVALGTDAAAGEAGPKVWRVVRWTSAPPAAAPAPLGTLRLRTPDGLVDVHLDEREPDGGDLELTTLRELAELIAAEPTLHGCRR